MTDSALVEENTELRSKIQRLELALMNAEAIAQTLVAHGEMFDEIHLAMNKLGGQFANLENEVGTQKNLIVRSLQQKYGHGATE